jgi:hypothetical protein
MLYRTRIGAGSFAPPSSDPRADQKSERNPEEILNLPSFEFRSVGPAVFERS